MTDLDPDTNGAEAIVKRITLAILEHRLRPGTKLGEEDVAEVFAVSRAKVRQALMLLAKNGLVELQPSRGAFVAKPSVREAREIFEVRRMLEIQSVKNLLKRVTDEQVQRLRAHVELQRRTLVDRDIFNVARLFSEFHMMIAEMAGNQLLAELLAGIVARSTLVILLYNLTMPTTCSCDEHACLVEAIAARNAEEATRLVAKHLEHLEQALTLDDEGHAVSDLKRILNSVTV
ncbi:MAG TPA: GntR family transcriptional regulator [Candidatus Competibacteraceae bacterium]|nr:GntR family transcriptional regulator [Candidatus Competibacteraceae bacterium]